ncbi:MAG: PAS domain-containing protein [Candidatus Geothermincolia bacterium]
MMTRNNIRALVIEDDKEMASLLMRIISNKFSIDVDIAYDCASAKDKLVEQDYDLITLDYRLPDGAGLDLLDEITGGGRPHPPVIMVTGHGDEETAARSFRSRASGYVVKDAKLPELLTEAVQKALAEISLQRVEKELLDEKVFIEDVLNGLPDLFAVVDMQGKFFRWNQKVCEVTGYTNAEISGMTIIELFRPEDRANLIEGMGRMREEGFALDEAILETKSGEQRYYELSGRLLRNYDGIPIGFSGIGRDVTERVRANEELARYREELEELVEERTAELTAANERREHELAERIAAEEHYRSILENSMDVLAIFDEDATVVDISPSIEPLLGYTPDEVKGLSVFDFIHPDDLAHVVQTHKGVADGSSPTDHMKTRFKHRDGSWHTLSAVGRLYTGREGQVRIIVNARDISETERAQEALRESEKRYRSIFELGPDFVFLVGSRGELVDANDALLQRAGLPMEVLAATTVMDWFTGDNKAELMAAVDRLRRGEEIRGLEVLARNGKGEDALYEVNAIPFVEDGKVTRTLCLARDITQRKKAEEELKRLNRELEGYAQTVSHDLRGPLTSIKLAGDNLNAVWSRKDVIEDLDGQITRIAEVVLASASQAETLIADLLFLARAGQEPEEVSDVDISSTVRRILEEHDPAIRDRGVTVVLSEDLGTIKANPTQVYQVFSNLIDNGIKYNTSENPLIEVKYLGRKPSGHVYMVKDNGPGIPKEEQENIFMPFHKGESGSTGIGLAIVEKIVKVYNGSLRVYTNGGTCFEISLKDR